MPAYMTRCSKAIPAVGAVSTSLAKAFHDLYYLEHCREERFTVVS